MKSLMELTMLTVITAALAPWLLLYGNVMDYAIGDGAFLTEKQGFALVLIGTLLILPAVFCFMYFLDTRGRPTEEEKRK